MRLVPHNGLRRGGIGELSTASACLKSDHLYAAKRYCLGLA
jgi:hypothetical protein